MILRLSIQNYAIIDDLEINFLDKLNIITGETGAGKSILMGALSLILGERADSNVLNRKDKKCMVEGFFTVKDNKNVIAFLFDNDLDAEEELVIRREIAINGKSRAFVNDTPVSLNQLKELSVLLADLHKQFDTLELNNSDFQQEVLDVLAENGDLLIQYGNCFQNYLAIKKETDELKGEQSKANAELDYNKYLFEELNSLGLKEFELEELDSELKLLNNAETVKQQLGHCCLELSENELPIVQQLKLLCNKLHLLESYDTDIPELVKRLHGAQVELKDIAEELERINAGIQYSAERIQAATERISAGYKLLKKHGVHTTAELLQIMHTLEQRLNDTLNITEIILQKENLAKELLIKAEKLADGISINRKRAIEPFTEKVNRTLVQVGMPSARFSVVLYKTPTLQYTGSDKIEFQFDANKSGRFESLRKVASGGELSRLMLCIKSLVARQLQLPTLIFDEIDSGISGEAAKQVGKIMKALSGNHQIISITHQPQIAAMADAHYFVYKAIEKDKIVTSVRLLNNDERITTIAQMMSGEKPTAAALQNAREMIGN